MPFWAIVGHVVERRVFRRKNLSDSLLLYDRSHSREWWRREYGKLRQRTASHKIYKHQVEHTPLPKPSLARCTISHLLSAFVQPLCFITRRTPRPDQCSFVSGIGLLVCSSVSMVWRDSSHTYTPGQCSQAIFILNFYNWEAMHFDVNRMICITPWTCEKKQLRKTR